MRINSYYFNWICNLGYLWYNNKIYKKGFKMAIILNKSTQILISNFIDKYFSNIPSENREQIKKDSIEIVDSIIKQCNKDLDDTKGDSKDLKYEAVLLKSDLDKVESKLETKITEIKVDLLMWIFTIQIVVVGLFFILIKLI